MRKQARAYRKICRSKQQKELRKQKEIQDHTPEKVFSYEHFVKSAKKCMKNVAWKASVQNYRLSAISNTYRIYKAMQEGKMPKYVSGREIVITERGKARVITPIHIKDRVLQKTLCDYALVPVLSRKLIYDNGASMEGKGVSFTRERLEKHLKAEVKKSGNDFYVLTYDIKDFFGSIPHRECRAVLERYFGKEIAEIAMEIIKNPLRIKAKRISDQAERRRALRDLERDRMSGICLGSQESQTMALAVPNRLDHLIKDKLRVKHYLRYMDDGILIAKTKEELCEILKKMKTAMDELGMRFNEKKTRIAKAGKGFTFLKVKYHVTKTGKIIRRLTAKGVTRMRRKLKKFRAKVTTGKMSLDNVYDSIQSWLAHAKIARSYRTVNRMLRLYRKLFGGYGLIKTKKRRMEEWKWSTS